MDIRFADRTPAQYFQHMLAYFGVRVEYGIPAAINITTTYATYAAQNGLNLGDATDLAVAHSGYHCYGNWLLEALRSSGVKVYGYIAEYTMAQQSNPFPELEGSFYGQGAQMLYKSNAQGNFKYNSGFSSDEEILFTRIGNWLGHFFNLGNPLEGWHQFNVNDVNGNNGINLINADTINGIQMRPLPNLDGLCAIWHELIPEDVPPVFA